MEINHVEPERRLEDTGLFVGGVADGYGAQVEQSLNITRFPKSGGGYAVYHRELFAGEAVAFSFWRSDDLSLDEALRCLFERYQGANRYG